MVKKDITMLRRVYDVLLVFTAINGIILSLIYLEVFAVIPIIALLILIPYLIRRRYVEFEYILTNDQLDFDKIYGKRYRKHLYTVNVREIELMAPMIIDFKDEFFNVRPQRNIDLSTNSHAPGRWFIAFSNHKDGKVCVVFEPTVKMAKNIYSFNSKKVLGMDYVDRALENGEML